MVAQHAARNARVAEERIAGMRGFTGARRSWFDAGAVVAEIGKCERLRDKSGN